MPLVERGIVNREEERLRGGGGLLVGYQQGKNFQCGIRELSVIDNLVSIISSLNRGRGSWCT